MYTPGQYNVYAPMRCCVYVPMLSHANAPMACKCMPWGCLAACMPPCTVTCMHRCVSTRTLQCVACTPGVLPRASAPPLPCCVYSRMPPPTHPFTRMCCHGHARMPCHTYAVRPFFVCFVCTVLCVTGQRCETMDKSVGNRREYSFARLLFTFLVPSQCGVFSLTACHGAQAPEKRAEAGVV